MFELAEKADVAPSGTEIHKDTNEDKSGAKPEGKAIRGRGGEALNQLKLLQEKTKARNDKAEPHEGQAGANPSEESAFGC